ncbi:MAG: diphthine--ammonia ligase [Candidatus Woesearchaeota archaeon]
MCGIIGVFGSEDAGNDVLEGMKLMQSRGEDGFGITTEKDTHQAKKIDGLGDKDISGMNAMGHNLHSIVGDILQPLEGERGSLVINCEIYNWKELDKEYNYRSANDSELVLKLIEDNIESLESIKDTLERLDGVYSFAYWDKKEGNVYLARDILGVKPLWFTTEDGLAFASERKALYNSSRRKIVELNPRKIMVYDIKDNTTDRIERPFFTIRSIEDSKTIHEKTKDLLYNAIQKRIPERKVGVLFSGGIDSVFIAYVLKEMGIDFTCYTTALEEESMGTAIDLETSEEVAAEFGLKLKTKKLSLKDTERYITDVAPLIEDNNVVKVGVGVTMLAACEEAKKDGVKVIFSGLGSEEVFAGYERHKDSTDINKECLSGLLKIYERDLYRDDVITMKNGMELRVPFLDKELVSYSLGIPDKMKIDEKRNKIVLRDISKSIGIPEKFAEKKKRAAQYGSKIDRAIQRLARKQGFERKSEYLRQFYKPPNVRLGVLWSGGKDSAFAAWIMKQQNYELSCLISVESTNEDSYMFHTPNISIVDMHSEASGIPLVKRKTEGQKEEELSDLREAIKEAKEKYGIEGVVTGAIFSNYQRDRVEAICDEQELKIFSPLWHMEQKSEMKRILKEGFVVSMVKIAGYGLDKDWLGESITMDSIRRLVELNERYKINIAGEGGEFETLVLDAPFFKKKIIIDDYTIEEDSENSATLKVTGFHME